MKPVVMFFATSFVLHLFWENFQMPLFEPGNKPFWEDFKMCLWATATGDMLFMLTLYLSVGVIHKNVWWVCDRSSFKHPATWIVPVIIGVLLAVSFELWAVYATNRWVYSSMPIIPVVKVGLTPVLQMVVIPLAATASGLWLARRAPSASSKATS